MKLFFTGEFKRNYKKLPASLRKQAEKQLGLLITDFRHPSLRSRKMVGYKDVFEARVSRGYRMRYVIVGEKTIMLTIGPHDVGLGKK